MNSRLGRSTDRQNPTEAMTPPVVRELWTDFCVSVMPSVPLELLLVEVDEEFGA